MYLFIFNDGHMSISDNISSEDYQAVDGGVLEIVKIVFKDMKIHYEQYYEKEWHIVSSGYQWNCPYCSELCHHPYGKNIVTCKHCGKDSECERETRA